jgi:hypothetical protein
MGGAAAPGGTGGSNQYDYVLVDYFCVVGNPSGDGQDLVVGMPLVISRHPSGCHPSSCTVIDDASCDIIGSDHQYWVSGFVGLTTQGEACSGDCSSAAFAQCDLGLLTAGEYSVGLGGVAAPTLRFTVPSHVTNAADLCVSTGMP